MGARQRMTMRAVLQRNRAQKNPYGHTGGPDWRTLESAMPCLAWETTAQTSTGNIVIEAGTPMMIFPLSVEATIDDRIESVSDRIGNQLFGTMVIDAVMRRKDHFEARLKRAV